MPVVPVGVADDGQMEVRPDVLEAGWYRFGPTVGAKEGTAVVAAHAGSYVTPRGPFYDLKDARPGDVVRVARADGAVLAYEVTSVENVDKDVIDLERYFRRDGDPRLVLFTCGGRWDEARQSYDDNVVVSARPADG
ncbi:class F sortase [Georgenia sp. SUBG003]|uniref:class F sortase n=1 Tax=Georgenia sp. SUBG003 TaxID=1497974 RepID=UPI0005BD9E63